MFGTDDVVGMSLDITCYDVTKSFRIAGVTTQKENGTFVSYTYEGMPVTVNIPYSAMNELVGDVDYFYSMTVQVDTSLDSQKVANEIVHLLVKRHQTAGDDYFQIQNFQDVMKSMNQMLGMVTAFISFVAGISLLVGGIGVMNIMMVSVTERTREIGTRKALGAPASAIRMQFITESVILCLIGGFIGIVLGLALGTVLSNVVGYAAKPSIAAILIAVGFSMAIGVFFGYYPANKAAKLDPIEALRYE